ncbi:unnamed protein product [Prunus armeniaca]
MDLDSAPACYYRMGSLAVNIWRSTVNNAAFTTPLSWGSSIFISGNLIGLYDAQKVLPAKLCSGVSISPRAFASRNSVKKLRRDGEARKRVADKSTASEDDYVQIDKKVDPSDNLTAEELVVFPSRGAVLQACTVTSGLIAALGIIIRQASHVASIEGLPVFDCSLDIACMNFHLLFSMQELSMESLFSYSLMRRSTCIFGKETAYKQDLSRVGCLNLKSYFKGQIASWKGHIDESY